MNEWDGFSAAPYIAAKFLYQMVMVISVYTNNPSDPVTIKTIYLGFRTQKTCEATGAELKAKIDRYVPSSSARGGVAEYVCYPTNK